MSSLTLFSSPSFSLMIPEITGIVTTLSSLGFNGTLVKICSDLNGHVYTCNNASGFSGIIYKNAQNGSARSDFAGNVSSLTTLDGTGTGARFNGIEDIGFSRSTGNILALTTGGGTTLVREITPGGVVTTWPALTGSVPGGSGGAGTHKITIDNLNNMYVLVSSTLYKIEPSGVCTNIGTAVATVGGQITFDIVGNRIIVNDTTRLKEINITTAVVTNIAGSGTSGDTDGAALSANIYTQGVVAHPLTGVIYFVNARPGVLASATIRKLEGGNVTTIAGASGGTTGNTDGTGIAAQFDSPRKITYSELDNYLYVTDQPGGIIRRIA